MPKIFGTGMSGLIGTKIVELLEDKYTFVDLSYATGIDITKPETLEALSNDTESKVVIHMAAKADVDGCENDKALGIEGDAYKINVKGTQNIVDACKKTQKKIIYISTDFVFDGENTPKDGYKETDLPYPVNWYSETKYLGEQAVLNSGLPYILMRIAYPYRSAFPLKKDFVQGILDRLQNQQEIKGVTDHIMNPTYVDDIAHAMDALIQGNHTGIFHVVGSNSITPYDAAIMIAETFGCNKDLITKTTRAEFFKDRAPRPFNLSMNNDKIKQLGVRMRSFREGLIELRE